MSKVALVSHDVQTVQGRAGGVGAFVTHYSTLLRDAGEEVTIILARAEPEPREVDEVWRARYRSLGIQLVERHNAPPRPDRWSGAWPLTLSEQVAPLLADFDVVYFADWANVGFLPARQKRFTRSGPTLVTVLHGPSSWVRLANREYPKVPEDLHVDFIERYAAVHSDFVIAPSQYILGWLREQGWRFESEPAVLGLPYRPPYSSAGPSAPAPITRLVFFGRLEPRKGFSLLVAGLRSLNARSNALRQVTEIVLLGPEYKQALADRARTELEEIGVQVCHIANLDSLGVHRYLSEHASGTLVAIASSVENFPYAVIEACSIPGLNVICSRGGGVPEIFCGRGEAQLFDPHPTGLAAKIEERLERPLASDKLASYDFERANAQWLEFHGRICARAVSAQVKAYSRPSLDVCITYFNKQQYFPQLLTALERQTVSGFGVVAVDDGSTSAEAIATFDALAERYASRDWNFVRQSNSFVDAARNRAAERSSAEYLLFIDADDVLAPNAIERLTEAAMLSGCDCLSTYGCLLGEGDAFPFDSAGQVACGIQARYTPLGPSLVIGLVDPFVFGLSMILIRREVFMALGGYREIRGAAHEDWELQLRLLLGNYQTDVLPEYLLFFHRLADGLARSSDEFSAKRRLLETYEARLTQFGFNGVAGAMHALEQRCQELESVVRQNVPLDVRLRLHDRLRTLLSQTSR